MKILFTASECVPFIKTGGLADVVGALAPVLAKQGHDVRVMLPLYAAVPKQYVDQMTHVTDFEVALGWRRQYCGIELLEKDGVKFYFVDNKFYFGRPYIYGMGGDEYERFGFFCRAALNALPLLDFQPDVIHAHDWQSGMVPALLKIQYAHLPFFANIKTMFTIHNLQYQGVFGIREVQDVLGLGDSLWTDDKLECYGCANFMKAALVYSDIITTVSPSYAEEIQTAYYGERLDGLLRARKHEVFGVLNGIDMADYNPATDARIPAEYTADDLSGKAKCKAELQEKLGLTVDPNVPIIGMVGRLSSQKGLDLVDYIIGDLMSENVQLVVLGMGESRYVNLFSWAEGEFKGKVAARFAMDHALAHQIYAGCDMFLMPSQFEPCGLSQLIALRYGTVPIVRETGGLRDTVLSYNEYTGDGNGFTFFNYNANDMLNVINRAIDYYENHKDVIKEDDLLWKYKWIWACTFDLPEIPMEQVQAIGEDYKTRILRNGYSLRSYYHRWSVECVWMRQYDKAKEYIDKMLNEKIDDQSCEACELNFMLDYYLETGQFDEAYSRAQPLINKQITCYEANLRAYLKLAYYAQKAGKPEIAADMCARAEEALVGREKDEYLLLYLGLFIAYNMMTKPERAWEYAERCIGWSLRTNTLKSYRFSCDMVEALKYETRPEVSLSLPEEFPLYRPDGIYQVNELRNYFYQQAEELARRYDARNGNSGYMDRLKDLMSN